MSWHYSRALVEAYSAENSLAGAPSAQSNASPTPQAFLSPDRMKAFSRLSRFGMTFAPLTGSLGADVLTWYLAGFPARTSVPQEATASPAGNIMVWTENLLASGLKWSESLAKSCLKASLSKTPRILELAALSESSRDLPRWGMMQGGAVLTLCVSGQTTSGNACSLLPTPTAHNSKEGAYPAEHTRRTPTLAAQIGGKINPDWNEWRMGWPPRWTDLRPLGTGRFQPWLNSHGKP